MQTFLFKLFDISPLSLHKNLKKYMIDSGLIWKTYTDYEYVNNTIIIYQLFFYLLICVCKLRVLKSIHCGIIPSKLEYGIIIWRNTYTYNTILKIIIKLQKHFILIMFT